MNPKSQNFKQEKSLFKMIYITKKPIPQQFIYTWVFFIFKFFGILITSNNFKRISENEGILVTDALRFLTFYKNLKDPMNLMFIDYNLLCFIIYVVLIVPFIILFIIYKFKANQKDKYKFTKIEKIVLKFAGVIIGIKAFLFQYLIEILSLIYLDFYVSLSEGTNIPIDVKNSFKLFDDSLIISKYFFMAMNFIVIISLNTCLFFYFKILNEPFFSSTSQIKLVQNSPFMICLILCFNFQGLHYFDLAFTGEANNIVKIILMSLSLTISLLALVNFYTTYHFNVFLIKICIFFLFSVIIGCVIDIFIFAIPSGTYLRNKQILSLLLIITFSVLFSIILIYMKRRKHITELEKNIFSKNKKVNSNSCFILIEIISNCINNTSNFLILFDIFNKHKIKCTNELCSCNKFKFNKFQENILKGRFIHTLINEEKMKKFNIFYQDIIILCENEITNTLHLINKHGEVSNDSIVILYFDFLFYIKNNSNFAYYIIKESSNQIKDIPLYFNYYFFIYKLKICRENFAKIKSQPTSKNNFFYEFFDNHIILERLNSFMMKTCDDFHTLMKYKNDFEENKIVKNDDVNSIVDKVYILRNMEKLFETGNKLNKHYKRLGRIIRQNFTSHKFRNVEMCYLLTQFYNLINKEIPINLIENIKKTNLYEDIEKSFTIYDDDTLTYPILVNVEKKNLFKIKYISQRLCESLSYDKIDLIDQDFHILMPPQFVEDHKLLINKVMFHESKMTYSTEMFMMTKEKYFYGFKMTSCFFPTMNDNILTIIDIKPIDLEKHQSISAYEFITNLQGGIICYSKNFDNSFNFNNEMITKLKLNLGSLFDINFEQIQQRSQEDLIKMSRFDSNYIVNYTKLFSYNDLDESLTNKNKTLKDEKDKTKQKNQKRQRERCIEIKKRKDKLLPCLAKLIKMIQESEFDVSWIQRISEIEKSIYRYSSLYKLNDFKSIANKKKTSSDYYFIEIYMRKMGNVPYYKIKVYDHLDSRNFLRSGSTLSYYNLHRIESRNSSNNHLTESSVVPKSIIPIINKISRFQEKSSNGLLQERDLSNTPIDNNLTNNKDNTRITENNPISNLTLSQNILSTSGINESVSTLLNTNKFDLFKYKKEIIEDDFNETTTVYIYEDKQLIKKKLRLKSKKSLNKKKNRNIYLFLILTMLAINIFLSIKSFFDKNLIFSNSQNFLNIYFFSMNTKASLYFSSLLSILNCEIIDGTVQYEQRDDKRILFNEISSDLLSNFYKLNNYIHTVDKSYVDDIYNLYYINPINIKLLHSDWSIKLRQNTTLHEELIYYHYYIRNLADQQDTCRLEQKFFYNKNLQKENSNDVSFTESVIYYIFENVIPKYNSLFETISYSADKHTREYFQNSRLDLIVMDVVMIGCNFILFLIFFFSVRNYKKKMTHLLLTMLKNKEKEQIFQEKLLGFISLLSEKDSKSFINYEDKLRDLEMDVIIKLRKSLSDKRTLNDTGLANNSLFKFKLKKVKTAKNDSQPLDLPNVRIKIIRMAYIFLVFGSILFNIIIGINIKFIGDEFSNLIMASQISANFKARISNFAQLALYYKSSIIKNNPNYLTYSNEDYYLRDYSNYFSASADFSTDSTYTILKESEFSIIYYNLNKNFDNVEAFMSSTQYSTNLKNLQIFENKLRTKDVCLHYAELNKSNRDDVNNQLDGFKLMNEDVEKCKGMGPEISLNGLHTGLKILLNSIRNSYLDFAQQSNRNIVAFLSNSKTFETFNGIQTILKPIMIEFDNIIKDDIDELFKKFIVNEMIFSAAILVFNAVFFFIMIIFFIFKLESYFEVLEITLKRLDKAMD